MSWLSLNSQMKLVNSAKISLKILKNAFKVWHDIAKRL